MISDHDSCLCGLTEIYIPISQSEQGESAVEILATIVRCGFVAPVVVGGTALRQISGIISIDPLSAVVTACIKGDPDLFQDNRIGF